MVTLLLAALLAGCAGRPGALAAPRRDESGLVVAGGVAETGDLQGGDCFNNSSSSVVQVTVVPCDQAHDYELFFSYNLTGGPYPGEELIKQDWMRTCMDHFEGFVGRSFDDSTLDVSAIYPTELTWNNQSDRQVLCSVTAADGRQRLGSARSSQA